MHALVYALVYVGCVCHGYKVQTTVTRIADSWHRRYYKPWMASRVDIPSMQLASERNPAIRATGFVTREHTNKSATVRTTRTRRLRVDPRVLHAQGSRGRVPTVVLSCAAGQKLKVQAPNSFELAALFGAAALWGSYPSTIKSFFASPGSSISAAEVTLIRFLVMAIASSAALTSTSDGGVPALWDSSNTSWADQLRQRVPSNVYLASTELGAIALIGSYSNTMGLQQIPAQSAAVLLTFLNIFTPLVAAMFGATKKERTVDPATWLGSFLALGASSYALLPDTPGVAGSSAHLGDASSMLPALGTGELQVLSAAFFFAVVKVRLSSHLKVHPANQLTAGRLVAQAGLAALGLGINDETQLVHELLPIQQGGMGMSVMEVLDQVGGWVGGISVQQVWWIVSSALLSGSCATWLQSKAQATMPAPTAQRFYSTTPVFGALWALLLLQEPITNHELVGGTILLLSLGTTSLIDALPQKLEQEETE